MMAMKIQFRSFCVVLVIGYFGFTQPVFGFGIKLPTPSPTTPPVVAPAPQPISPPAIPPAPTPQPVPTPAPTPEPLPVTSYIKPLWETKHVDGKKWTEHVLLKLDTLGGDMLSAKPVDENIFCPNYSKFSTVDRKYFWAYLMSAMVRFESNFKPEVKYQESFQDSNGNNVISRGLLQISYESGRGYQCDLRQPEDLHDSYVNLECGIRILNRWVGRDQRIAGQDNGAWRGGARYWSVMRSSSKSYAEILKLLNQYTECFKK